MSVSIVNENGNLEYGNITKIKLLQINLWHKSNLSRNAKFRFLIVEAGLELTLGGASNTHTRYNHYEIRITRYSRKSKFMPFGMLQILIGQSIIDTLQLLFN